ncbi:FtsK/SpoIIIE domain-containing protein [Streptomyces sp. NPDC051940]|uniref:FtsK/SpoIIIE domain-containing protein n=1 Tax=Streptomyces sp. NPDC051940 TaxID=3155675 RepID=UPI00344029D2
MQIRMTVLGPRGPQGARGSSVDVLVTAPSGTPLSAVAVGLADAAAAAGGGTAPQAGGGAATLFAGERLLDPDRSTLGEPPLVDGAVLSLGGPGVPGEHAEAPVRLLVAAGPDAGGVHLLHGGQVRIGRSADAEVPIDDPDVSRLHCVVTVAEDGRAHVADLGSTNGTTVDGVSVGPQPVPLRPGALLRIGESVLRLSGDGGSRGGATRPAASPEHAQVPDSAPVWAPDPGGTHTGDSTHLTGGTHGNGLIVPGPGATPLRGTPAPPLDAQGTDPQGARRGGLKGWARRFSGGAASDPSARPVPEAEAETAEPRRLPEQPHRERWPDPAEVLLTALGGGAPRSGTRSAPRSSTRLGERDAEHPDALTVRLGTADGPGRPDPLVVSLREAGSLGLAGPRPRLTGLARSVLAQLATLHATDELELVLLASDRSRPLAQRLQDWSWLGWLPQLRPLRGQDCRLLTAYDREQAAARLGELLRRLEVDPGGPAHTVVVVDGDPGPADVRDAVTRLAVRGPAAGIHLLCLAETPSASPASPLTAGYEAAGAYTPGFAECGAVAMLSGDVATGLRLLRRPATAAQPPRGETGTAYGTGQAWLYGPGPDPHASSGGGWFAAAVADGHGEGLSGEPGTVDAVSAAWAERLARALAPLRDLGPRDGGERPAGELPESVRLLDELGLARATPTALTARWAERTRALAVFGAGPRGPLEADLAADGMHHVFVEGLPGSGKTELLRSLAASLAASERPDRLQLVLIDGGGAERGEGLRVCTDLPHVSTYLPANDPVRMREFAQSLAGELKRRAEVLAASFGSHPLPGQRPAPADGDLDPPPSATLSLRAQEPHGRAAEAEVSPEARRRAAQRALESQPRLVVVVDDYDALVAPSLGSPARPAAGSVVRALDAVAREGARLGLDLIAATGRPERTAGTTARAEATLLVRLGTGPDVPPGRGELHRSGSMPVPFQAGRVTGRIPRTATARPTVVPVEWARMGAPPTSRPLRELGNGPTDLALLASALQRAAQSAGAEAARVRA